jgi:predicted RNA-binding Zn ribbon-like protein
MTATPEERKEWVDGFVLIGNHTALDFLNTKPVLPDGPKELLADSYALERWLNASGLLTSQRGRKLAHRWSGTPEAEAFLQKLIAFRERLRAAVNHREAGSPVSGAFLSEVNELLEKYPVRTVLRQNDRQVERLIVFEPREPDDVWAPIADATGELLSHIPSSRVRKCESCVLHFYDTSKKGSRRWCSMNICGNKVKVAAYQLRNRAAHD